MNDELPQPVQNAAPLIPDIRQPELEAAAPAEPPVAQMEPPAPPPSAPGKTGIPAKTILIGTGIFVLLFLIVGMFFIRYNRTQNAPVAATPTPTSFPTPTPLRTASAISTTSAFLLYQSDVASLSATLNAFQFDDQMLTSPTFELDLGLSSP